MVCDFLANSLINVLYGTLSFNPNSTKKSWRVTFQKLEICIGGVGALVHSNENLFDQYELLLLN
jgi:hypothetical protein